MKEYLVRENICEKSLLSSSPTILKHKQVTASQFLPYCLQFSFTSSLVHISLAYLLVVWLRRRLFFISFSIH